MLETCVNQGAGLLSLATQTAPRVMAMASHGNQQGELPLLWSLCATMVECGHSVAVLDATTMESTDNPGLAQLLEDAYWRGDESSEPLSWSVIPAARGLRQLCNKSMSGNPALEPLSGLFENFGVIVIYAQAEVLSLLLPDTGIEPLLTVAPVKMSPVTAYQALKKMLLNAKLRPTLATIVSDTFSKSPMASKSPDNNLQECAMTFLGYRLDSLAVRAPQPDGRPSDDIHRLALRLLEKAMPLNRYHSVGTH